MIEENEKKFLMIMGVIEIPTFVTNTSLAILNITIQNFIIFYTSITALKTFLFVMVGVNSEKIINYGTFGTLEEKIVMGSFITATVILVIWLWIYTNKIIKKYSKENP